LSDQAAGKLETQRPVADAKPAQLMRNTVQAAHEWPERAFYGVLLGAVALGSTWAGGYLFAGFIALVALAAAREWHRMAGGQKFALEIAVTTAAIVACLAVEVAIPHALWPIGILGIGSVLAAVCARIHRAPLTWNGAGALYIGVPALSIVALRTQAAHGAWVVIGLFIAVWAADTGALVLGRFLGGPKLVPILSPNKTWAGIIGGTIIPAAAMSLYVMLLGGSGGKAALLGLVFALAGHAGDLFESWLKRRVGRKNSGSLIPGHGGVLDRIDSTLFVAPLAAALVFVFGLDPLFGAHP
jgi:phosphatidate cytidylyltransferase